METNDSASSTNTVLIVIILVLLVGFGVWFFSRNKAPEDNGTNINVSLPGGGSSSGTNGGTTTP